MDQQQIIDITREAVLTTLQIGAPIMLIGLVVGLCIALFQALTQIQEMTLAFVPKIVAIFLAFFFMLPFMSNKLMAFTEQIADMIVAGGQVEEDTPVSDAN